MEVEEPPLVVELELPLVVEVVVEVEVVEVEPLSPNNASKALLPVVVDVVEVVLPVM